MRLWSKVDNNNNNFSFQMKKRNLKKKKCEFDNNKNKNKKKISISEYSAKYLHNNVFRKGQLFLSTNFICFQAAPYKNNRILQVPKKENLTFYNKPQPNPLG